MTSSVPASPSTSSASILQYRSVADDYRMSRVHLASQVHKAIRDGEYAWLPDLVVASPTNHNNGGSTNISLNLNNNDNNAAEILWEANSSGWTALHYAASHFLPLEWWRWILERAVSGSPSCGSDNSNHINGYHHRFQTVRNDLGETVLDIFFRSFLAPLPWQSTQVKNCSKLLLQAMDRVCGDPTLLRQTREQLDTNHNSLVLTNSSLSVEEESAAFPLQELNLYEFPSSTVIANSGTNNSNNNNNMAVLRCVCFCRNLQILCEVAQTGQLISCCTSSEDSKRCTSSSCSYYGFANVIPFLAETGGCPESFARLALALYPERALIEVAPSPAIIHNSEGRLVMKPTPTPGNTAKSTSTIKSTITAAAQNATVPTLSSSSSLSSSSMLYPLHLWSASCNSYCKVMNGIQRPLLTAFPEAAWTADAATGRYPLHHALASGNKSWQDVAPLFEAAPFVLECIDPMTGLYPMALLALPRNQRRRNRRTLENSSKSSLLLAAQSTDCSCPPEQGIKTDSKADFDEDSSNDQEAIEIRARQRSAGEKGLVSLWYIMPMASRREAVHRAAKELDCEHLTSIYLALKAFPRALPSSMMLYNGCAKSASVRQESSNTVDKQATLFHQA